MAFVLDASVTLAWLFEDEARPETDSILDRLRHEHAIVPAIWMYEIANALTVGQRRERLTEAKAVGFAELLRSLPLEVAPPAPMPAIMAVAARHELSAYDVAYLELAERADLPLASLDGRLRAAAIRAGVAVQPG